MHLFKPHQWTQWQNVGTCRQMRRCTIPGCTKTETRANHDLTEWTHIGEHVCKQERHCKRCSFSQEQDVDHSFSDWEYFAENCCTQRRVCTRCNHAEYREKCEQSTEIYVQVMGQCAKISKCPRCGEKTISSAEHQWVDNIVTYADCLEYRKSRHQQVLSNLKHEIEILEDSHMFQDSYYHAQRAKRNDIQQKISQDECLLRNESLKTIGAKICQRCLYIKRFAIREPQATRNNPKVFISYSHSYEEEQVWNLEGALRRRGFLVTIDKTDLHVGDDISAFVECVRDHDYVLCIISVPYIESIWCMSEAVTFMNERNYKTRMLPILGDSTCFKIENSAGFKNWWNEAIKSNRYGVDSKYRNMGEKIDASMTEFLSHITSTNAPSIADYESICHWMQQK